MPRIFVVDGREFPDPDPNLRIDAIRQHLANFFPELTNAETKESKRGEDTIIEFRRQPEDGHLHMPNYLVERFMKLHLSGAQWQVLWAVWRRTLCEPWGKRSARIRLNDLAADTQIHEKAVPREVKALTEMNIILRDPATSLTSFNPDPSTWVKRK